MSNSQNLKPSVKILYVEDDFTNRIVLTSILKTLGYENVTLAEDAKQAISLLEPPLIEFDIIFMDLGLPDMDGIELTKLIRQSNWKAKDLPIVAITGNEATTAKEKSFAAGMNGFLSKPVDKELMRTILESLLAK